MYRHNFIAFAVDIWRHFKAVEFATFRAGLLSDNSELLDDSVYQEMFDYHRNTFIAYVKRDGKRKNTSDKEYGEIIDILADIYNRNEAERVSKCKPLVDDLYKFWKENPDSIKDIRI